MAMKASTIGVIALVAVFATLIATYAALTSVSTFHNTMGVNAVGVGVFSDNSCTIPVTSINWGMQNPGDTPTQTVYVRNNGTVSVTLTMATANWNPSAAQGNFTVTWNQQNTVLPVTGVVPAIITLNVSSSAVGIASVTFDITITGTQ
ncbi:MAG: hypothetical protein ABSB89_00985 [Candidatus Bathyarchaeia archaeon]|jgi:hypothetical protein